MTERELLSTSDAPAPTEGKVKAARLAAFVATLVTAFLLKTIPALTPIGDLVSGWVGEIVLDVLLAAIVFVTTWWAGWRAKHTPRPDLPAAQR